MITIEQILAAAPVTAGVDQWGSAWWLYEMVQSLEREYDLGQSEQEDVEVANLMADVTKQEILDIPHGSDESCSVEIFLYKGKPLAVQKCVGDRSDYSDGLTVLDNAAAFEIVKRVLAARMDRKARKQAENASAPVVLDEKFLLSKLQYVHRIAPGVFSIESPKWALGFGSVIEQYPAWLINGKNELIRVRKFVNFTTKEPSWSTRDARARVMTDEGEVTVDARNILFTLAEGLGDLEAARERLIDPMYWAVLKLIPFERDNTVHVHIAQHLPGEVYSKCFDFRCSKERAADFEAILKKEQFGPLPSECTEKVAT